MIPQEVVTPLEMEAAGTKMLARATINIFGKYCNILARDFAFESKIYVSCIFCLFIACNPVNKDYQVKTKDINGYPMMICEEDSLGECVNINLSELIDSLEIIQLENKDSAYFKPYWFTISEHYIGIIQSLNTFKLFDRKGHFICNVGSVGQGPGEYIDINDALIDEVYGYIYLAPSHGSKSILKYDLQGKFIKELCLNADLFRPNLMHSSDSTIALTNMCFKDIGGDFVGATISKSDGHILKKVNYPPVVLNLNEGGHRAGLEHYMWSYRNTPNFSFKVTVSDTLYHYDYEYNKIEPVFTFNMKESRRGDSWFIFSELPFHYTVMIKDNGDVIIDKRTRKASYFQLKNDIIGNSELPSCYLFKDGYFCKILEPFELKETITRALDTGNYNDNKKEYWANIASSISDNDNSIILLGKLKTK